MTGQEARDDEREALIVLIDGSIPDDLPGYRQRYTEQAADAILDWLRARKHPEPETTAEDLLDTRAGMALARGAWQEGASAMLRSTNEHTDGPWSAPENPYSAPLLAMIAQARVPVGEGEQ